MPVSPRTKSVRFDNVQNVSQDRLRHQRPRSAGSSASSTRMFRRVVCVTNAPVPQGRLRDQRNVAQKPWGGPPSCDLAPLTTSLRGLWVSGNAGTGQWWNVRRGGDPKNRPAKGGTLEATWVRGEGTREPWRRGATDFLQVVAATACATVTSSKPTPLGMGCLWSASGTGLLGSGTG